MISAFGPRSGSIAATSLPIPITSTPKLPISVGCRAYLICSWHTPFPTSRSFANFSSVSTPEQVMNTQLDHYINGHLHTSGNARQIPVVNPANEAVVGHVTAGSADDLDEAEMAARHALDSFSVTPVDQPR